MSRCSLDLLSISYPVNVKKKSVELLSSCEVMLQDLYQTWVEDTCPYNMDIFPNHDHIMKKLSKIPVYNLAVLC